MADTGNAILTFSAKYIKVGHFSGHAFGPIIFSNNGFDICLDGGADSSKINILIELGDIVECLCHFSTGGKINVNVLFLKVTPKCASCLCSQVESSTLVSKNKKKIKVKLDPNSKSNRAIKYIVLSLENINLEEIGLFRRVFLNYGKQMKTNYDVVKDLSVTQVADILKVYSEHGEGESEAADTSNSSSHTNVIEQQHADEKSSIGKPHNLRRSYRTSKTENKTIQSDSDSDDDVCIVKAERLNDSSPSKSQNNISYENEFTFVGKNSGKSIESNHKSSVVENNNADNAAQCIVIAPEPKYRFHHLSEKDFNSFNVTASSLTNLVDSSSEGVNPGQSSSISAVSPSTKSSRKRKSSGVKPDALSPSLSSSKRQAMTPPDTQNNCQSSPVINPIGMITPLPEVLDALSNIASLSNMNIPQNIINPMFVNPPSPSNLMGNSPAVMNQGNVVGQSSPGASPTENLPGGQFNINTHTSGAPIHPAFPTSSNIMNGGTATQAVSLHAPIMAVGPYKGIQTSLLDVSDSGLGIWFEQHSLLRKIKDLNGCIKIPAKDIIKIMAYFSDNATSALFIYVSPIYTAKLQKILNDNMLFKMYETPQDNFNCCNLIVILLNALPVEKYVEVQQICFKMGMASGMGPILQVISFELAGKYLKTCFESDIDKVLSEIDGSGQSKTSSSMGGGKRGTNNNDLIGHLASNPVVL